LIVHPIDANLRVSDFDYHLPQELIAQEPPADRDGGRLLLVERASGTLSDLSIRDLPALLHPHDLVVVNNTRVLPARLRGRRETGGAVELLLLNRREPGRWETIAKPARRLQPGTRFTLTSIRGDMSVPVLVERNLGDGRVDVQFEPALDDQLGEFGEVPLPPYIHSRLADSERYQTVFSHVPGSAAAPTAGLHLSQAVLDEFAARGINRAEVTLQIGLDTFRPVTTERVADHEIHREWCSVPAEASLAIDRCRRERARVVAIGTTSARTLETWGSLDPGTRSRGWSDWTGIFITPGYNWSTVDALLTNFHLPKSTLLMMITSFAGRALTRAAYRHAVEHRYRFFSFGDAMLIV
jgi:S-adenosylmethionine:tRNA ribosyltransferase-isomerase